MPNVVKYSPGSTPTGCLKKGDFAIGNNTVDYGSSFYTGITPVTNGYTIYLNKPSNGPSIICPANDTQLIYWTKVLSGNTYATAAECLVWFAGQADKAVVNKDYEGIVINGLILNVDAGFIPSYPRSGNTWYDAASTNNGTLTNGPIYANESISFGGTDDYVNFGNIINSPTELSVNFWIKNPNNNVIITKGYRVWEIRFTDTEFGGYVGQNNGTSFWYGIADSNNILHGADLTQWNNFTYVYDFTNRTIKFYTNGVQRGSITVTNMFSTYATTFNLNIGRRVDSDSAYLSGDLSQLQIYNRTLTVSEIVQNYQAMLPRILTEKIVTTGLVLYVDAGNTKSYSGTGTIWYDMSGNNNNATLTNGPVYNSGDGGRFSVDGTDDYIAVSGMPTGNTWTYSMWYLVSGPTSFTVTGHRTFSASNTFRFQWDDNSTSTARGPFIDFTASQGGGAANYSNSQTPSTLFNQWHMVSVVSDGSNVTCYFDGSSAGGSIVSGSKQFSTNGVMRIGYDNLSGIGSADIFNKDGGSCYFSSAMVYNRALSAAEMLQNFNAQKVRFGL